MNKRRFKDSTFNVMTFISIISVTFLLGMIFWFVFSQGIGLLNFRLLTSDNQAVNYVGAFSSDNYPEFMDPSLESDVHFIERYGIGIAERRDLAGNTVIEFVYVDPDSPFTDIALLNGGSLSVTSGMTLNRVAFIERPAAQRSQGIMNMVSALSDEGNTIRELSFTRPGGGIRASLVSTLYLIGLTLVIVLPFGIMSGLYFSEFAKNNRLTRITRNFIEMLSGIPSIVFGLIGLSVLIPFTVRTTPATGGNLIAGALTLSAILLPIVIRTTEEGFNNVPRPYREASLALGANRTQTSLFIVIPGALSSILTTTFLAIGRIIGESAALIFVLGTAVRDRVGVFDRSPSLAVHIWALMTREPPNIELASTIAVIILIVVLILNLSIKLLVRLLHRGRY